MSDAKKRDGKILLSGMQGFMLIVVGQFFSLIGTGITRFALMLWLWEQTGQATTLALMGFFAFMPVILLSPIAGALTDRWNRKLTMMLSDLFAGLGTIALLFISLGGTLEVWHVYMVAVIAGIGETFQFPAYSAAISVMVNKEQYGRTTAMHGLVESASGIIAPVLGAILYVALDLTDIFIIDIVSFTFAIGTLLLVFIPPTKAVENATEAPNLWRESLFGFRYIWQRPSLLGLQMIFFIANFLFTISFTLLAPMILARTGNDELILGTVNSAMGFGGVLGGLFLSAWGGMKRRFYGVVLGWTLVAIFGGVMMGLGQITPVWIIAGFFTTFCNPLINASNQAIWMSKVPPALQGRVFSIRRLIAQATAPLSMMIAGPLADYIFEPAMMPDGTLTPLLGGIFGTGSGAGMGVMMTTIGILTIIVMMLSFLFPNLRHVETIIPDHDAPEIAVSS